MRCRVVVAETLRRDLVAVGMDQARVEKYSDAEILRMDGRAQRQRWGGQPLSPLDVVMLSRRRRRARQTHPGKRGRA